MILLALFFAIFLLNECRSVEICIKFAKNLDLFVIMDMTLHFEFSNGSNNKIVNFKNVNIEEKYTCTECQAIVFYDNKLILGCESLKITLVLFTSMEAENGTDKLKLKPT